MNSEIMIIGDTHGDLREYMYLLDHASNRGISKIFQAGDCGFFPSFPGHTEWLDAIQAESHKRGIKNYWIRGNHDDPDEWQHIIDRYANHNGWGTLRSNIFLAPRVHYFKHNGVRFLGVGGAVSIDKDYRLQNENSPGTLWWPNEVITRQDVNDVANREIDVLISHECSDRTPFTGNMKPCLDSKANRQNLDQILSRSRPTLHFHGHMHQKYEWDNRVIFGDWSDGKEGAKWVRTFGLQCNKEAMFIEPSTGDNWGILNTDTLEWSWQGMKN